MDGRCSQFRKMRIRALPAGRDEAVRGFAAGRFPRRTRRRNTRLVPVRSRCPSIGENADHAPAHLSLAHDVSLFPCRDHQSATSHNDRPALQPHAESTSGISAPSHPFSVDGSLDAQLQTARSPVPALDPRAFRQTASRMNTRLASARRRRAGLCLNVETANTLIRSATAGLAAGALAKTPSPLSVTAAIPGHKHQCPANCPPARVRPDRFALRR